MIQLGLYEWVIIFTNIFWTYTLYKFLSIFFNIKKTSPMVELISYVIYYLLLTIICIVAYLPIMLLIYNITALLALSYNYESTIKNRLLSAVFIYLTLAVIDILVSLLSGYLNYLNFSLFSVNTYSSIFGLIACRILTYAIVLVLNNFKNIKKGDKIPNSYWFSTVLIPTTSLYIILLLLQASGISSLQVMIGVILIFLINFATFYLYDVITAAISDKIQSLLIMEQNKYYDKQLETMKTSLQTTNSIRHDLKNHMFSIRSLIESDDRKESLRYISDILEDLGTRQSYSSTGNTVIDSIINFKFQETEQTGLKIDLDVKIPEKLEIPSIDMTIILGNLLDNALNAVNKVKRDRFINLKMKFDKGRLLIQADNPYAGEINEENGKLLTTDDDKDNHGIGLENIRKVIQKYNGTMDIDYSDNLFSVSLLLYLD